METAAAGVKSIAVAVTAADAKAVVAAGSSGNGPFVVAVVPFGTSAVGSIPLNSDEAEKKKPVAAAVVVAFVVEDDMKENWEKTLRALVLTTAVGTRRSAS